MRVLAHIHTLNDEEVIDRSIAAILEQTYPVDAILLVDNASTDGTLDRTFPPIVTIVKHRINTGTSGSVATGFEYAREKGYDWIWVLDADSRPLPDALEKLVALYEQFEEGARATVGALASRILRGPTNRPDDYGLLTPSGPRPATIDPHRPYYECDSGIWSGTLFRMAAVNAIDAPRFGPDGAWQDFGLDWGDIEYFYRLRRAGFRFFVHQQSFIRHALGWQRHITLFGHTIISTNHAAYRRYLYFRNGVYFWLYVYPESRTLAILRYLALHIGSQVVKILALEDEPWRKIRAISRGVWDGYHKRLNASF